MFLPRIKNTLDSCSKHNYTGINNPCPDCEKERINSSQLSVKKKIRDIKMQKIDKEKLIKITYTFQDGTEWYVEGKNLDNLLFNEELSALRFNSSEYVKTDEKLLRPVRWKKIDINDLTFNQKKELKKFKQSLKSKAMKKALERINL